MNINHEMKDSHYTSVHYVAKPDNDYNDVLLRNTNQNIVEEFEEKWTILLIITYKTENLLVENNLSHGETSQFRNQINVIQYLGL